MPDDALPEFTQPGPDGPWVASRYADVCAVLADSRFEVPPAPAWEAVDTMSWLRASVSRFTNGAEHQRRRALAVEELSRLEPAALRAAAAERTQAALSAAGQPGERVDVMATVARPVPMAVMAAGFGVSDPVAAATAVITAAAAYFPGADGAAVRSADAATACLVDLLAPADLDVRVARISLMIQGCDATAGLIGTALHILQDAPEAAAGWPTSALLAEVLRHSPVVRAARRVAPHDAEFGGRHVRAGDTVVCDVEAANRDPAVFADPGQFDPGRPQQPSLTFGYGVRPCPGEAEALMLAAGVVETVRERCQLLPGEQVTYGKSPLRIPQRLDVVLG